MSTLRQIREALQARLLLIKAPTYTSVDLSGSDTLKVGRPSKAWKLPCAALWVERDRATPGPTLSGRERTADFGLAVWMAATSEDPETREDLLEDVFEDIMKRFRASADRTLGGNAIDTTPSLDELVGAELEAGSQELLVRALFTIRYRENS
jgi:hypothetical protein